MAILVSPARSLKGWNLKTWFMGNWKTIKEALKIGVPAVVGLYTTTDPKLAGAITLVGKFLLDMGEYYFKEYKS